MSKHRIVIVGGGFGGVKAALVLSKDKRFNVTLISDNQNMQIYGSLYHTATGGSHKVSSIPLQEIFNNTGVHILNDSITSMDRASKTIFTTVGHSLSYDAIIFGLGVKTNYFGIKGLQEYSFGIKSLQEANNLKAHLHAQIKENNKEELSYVVVGGGPSGIEIAGVLPEYIKKITKNHNLPQKRVHVDLIEAAPRLVPRMPKDISKMIARNLRKRGVKLYLKTAVQAQTVDALMVNNQPIRSHTVIWTAGMSNNSFFSENNFQLTKTGKVRVDQFLQAEQGIYVIGDNADTPYSGMAQTALYDGKFVANNLIKAANLTDPKPYIAKKPIYVLPAGPKWAAVLWGKFRLYGRAGWALRRLADLIAYHDYEPWKLALKRYTAESEQEETCPECADELSKVNYLSGQL